MIDNITTQGSKDARNRFIGECVRKGLEYRLALKFRHDYERQEWPSFYPLTPIRSDEWPYNPPVEVLNTWRDVEIAGFLLLIEGMARAYVTCDPNWEAYLPIKADKDYNDKCNAAYDAYHALFDYWRYADNNGMTHGKRGDDPRGWPEEVICD